MNIYEMIKIMIEFWINKGCIFLPSSSMIMGAATFHPNLFFGLKNSNENNYVYMQQCIRRCDGMYGKSTNRLITHHQFQVIMQPVPDDFHKWMYEMLLLIGINSNTHIIQEIDSEWCSASLGAFGTGWEIRINTLEVLQYTYFEKFAHKTIKKTGELAFGIERLATVIQGLPIMDCTWQNEIKYKDLFLQSEQEISQYYLNENVIKIEDFYRILKLTQQCTQPIVKYEYFLQLNDLFNCLDALNILNHKTKIDMIKQMEDIIKNI